MSSSRNTKRKRSKAGAPATSSNRERAVAPEPAHPASATSISAAEASSNNKTADAATSTSITKPSSVTDNTNESASNALDDSPAEGKVLQSQSSVQSSEKRGMKNEADTTEPISKSSDNGKSTETDKMAATNSSNDKIQNPTPASALESIDASSSSTSSQDGTSTRRQALHIANDDGDREKRMRDLISHRSILLQRVRACRASAENRIGEKSDGKNNKINANDLSDNQEITAFRSMTKQANQAARKVKEGEGVGEKRTSLTLRRGSSVGKRMNAALSSLVPGSHVTGTTGGGANNPSAGHATTTTAGKPLTTNNSHSAESKSEVKGSSPTFTKYTATKSSGRLPINHLSNDSFSSTTIQTPSTSTKPNANSKSNKAHSPFPSQLTKQHDASTRGRPPNSKNTKIMKTAGAQIATAAQNPLSSAQNLKKNAALPMGVRSASMMTSPASSHFIAGKKVPKVNFPEAIALREKREQIEIQLRNLIERRQHNASMTSAMMAGSSKITASSTLEDESSRRKATPGSAVSAKPTSNKKMLHPAINKISNIDNGLEISSPASLPNRRRTHWDIVLQEMSWLASDFMEERKWKLSTSRLVSSNIPTHGLSDRRKRSPEASRGGSDSTPRELPSDKNNNTPGVCSSSDAPEDHGRGARILKKKDARRKYWVPAKDDDEMVKCRSQILSCMISELEAAIKKGGSLEDSDKHHEQALKRFAAQRLHIIRNMKNCNDPIFLKDSNVGGDTIKDSKSVRKSDEVSEDMSSQNESSFENIDDYIEHFHRVCKSKHKLPAKETAKALKSGKIKLTSKQKEMLEFVDKLWSGKPHSGAVVVGSSTSGMTFGTATVIWKQRTRGSQVLICPSRSLIRWKYELNRFSNIRVLTFGSSGGISNPDGGNNVSEIQSTDVILCEYGSVSRMKNALKRMSVNPFSVIVDLRHFVGLRKSLRASTSADSKDFPLELLSNNWWGEIVALVKSREIRCLLLEYYDSDPLSLSNCGLGQKEQISILAKRAACVIGPEVFDSRSHSIERQVIAWARKKGKNDILDKALRVRKILQDAIDPMCLRAAKPIVSSFDFEWELRSCEMSAAQRQEYDRCCYEVRGALSSTFEMPNSNRCHFSVPVVANALFRLRQECFYSRKHAIQSNYDESRTMNHKQHKAISSTKKKSSDIWVNPSQPDAAKAYSILKSSSKLKELVSILTSEGGYNLNFDESTKKMFGIMKGAKKGKDLKGDVKKIVIFAALPDFQQVVSTLLNSLGIQNELLCRYEAYVNNENGADETSPSLDYFTEKYEAIAWAKSQSVLSRFCSDNHTRKANIIIASPAALSGRNDGIGIEGADMLITLDSDWSGRDGFVVNSLVRRWQAKNKLCGKEDKLIRLVSADSIEEKIFDDNARDNGVLSWPVDTDGFFTLPASQHEASVLYKKVTENIDPMSCCPFPAMGVLQNRGYLLKVVLASNCYLPSLFGSGKPAIFLPRHLKKAPTDQEIIADLHFLKYFLRDERNSSVSTQSISLSKQPKVCQISSAAFISRKDMPMIGSRLCLEKLINSHSLSNDGGDHPSINSLRPDVLLNIAQAEGESSIPKIDENPSSLLFYEPYQESLANSEGSLIKNAESKTKRRYNAYAKLFSNSWNGISIRDGNQGCEPLVFFPPLFPLIDEVSKKARMHYDASGAGTIDTQGRVILTGNNDNSVAQKRKDRDFAMTYNDLDNSSKRPKIKSETGHKINGYAGLAPSPSKAISNLKDQPVAQNGKAQVCSPTSMKGFKGNKPCSPKLVMVGEDFGLLGSGAFPTPMDAISFLAHDAKVNRSYLSSWNKPDYGSHLLPCDPEETSSSASKHLEEGMQSVVLFVKKRPRSTQTVYRNGQGLHSIVPLPIGSKVVGDESAKKIKKRSQGNAQLPPTAFTRLPGNLGTQHSQMLSRSSPANSRQVKGDFRHKLLASFYSRQRATGLTLFDSIPYRVASMRVEKRVMARLEKLMWKSSLKFDVGPGLPIQLVEKSYSVDRSSTDSSLGWSSIIDQLKDGSSPGDIAKAQSRVQKLNFKRSSVLPHCVDFGAFEVGYLASPSGMTGIPRARIRVGVSLPMGVKVMQPTKDQERSSAWNMRDDKILQETVKKFGMNWLLVASATSGFEHAVINRKLPVIDNIAPSVAKSARQCQDRWQLLAQTQPSLANELRRSEIIFRETALSTCNVLEKITVANQKGTSSIFSAENINILCKSDDFLNLSVNKESTSDTDLRGVDNKESVKQSEVASPRSTVDKKDDNTANNHNSSHYVTENTNDPSSATEDVEMSDAFKVTKPKRRSFKSILGARSRRQIFPVTIPGVDVGGNQAGHPVPSHPSHMQSVQISVAAQWASGRTEMWPLQILDLADKQRSGAARINNMQRGEIPSVHNPSRRHPTGSSSYQHRPQPSQSSAVRAPVGYSPGINTTTRPVAPRPVTASVTPRHQHRTPQVADSTVRAYIPPQTTATGKPKKNDKQKLTGKTSPKKG